MKQDLLLSNNLIFFIFRPHKIGEKIVIKVRASTDLPSEVFSIVFSQNGIVSSQTHDTDGETSIAFPLTFTKNMAPSPQLLVYYIQTSGEMIYDRIKFEITHSENNVSDLKKSFENFFLISYNIFSWK
jgi:Alpha-2-macroglobulin bait region domain